MQTLTYEGYLTESKLVDVVRSLFPDESVETQYRLDYGPKAFAKVDAYLPQRRVAFEFDGYGHYRNSKQILRDRLLDAWCAAEGIRMVRVPYWLQLDDAVLRWAFGGSLADELLQRFTLQPSFPHGFHDEKATLPADFSIAGHSRYQRELHSLLPLKAVYAAVAASLAERERQLGHPALVYASELTAAPSAGD